MSDSITLRTKCCTKCQTVLPATLDHFPVSGYRPKRKPTRALRNVCRRCNNGGRRPKEKTRYEQMKRDGLCPECRTPVQETVFCRACADKRLDYYKLYHRVRRYGLTLAAIREMFDSQGGKCAICQTPYEWEHLSKGKNGTSAGLVIDHCHRRNKVRSLLCGRCNSALGFFRDSKHILLAAVDYLKKHE